jgi:hypothetical protein
MTSWLRATRDNRQRRLVVSRRRDGQLLLMAVAIGLMLAGTFALVLAATGELLPHDTHYLGMDADELCEIASCRIVDFMVHDRAAFGGTLLGLGVLYVWLTLYPLSRGEQWAWWVWLISGTIGFLSFLSYLGYGYLDTWHGIGTALMLPIYVVGMFHSRRLINEPLNIACLRQHGGWFDKRDRYALGRSLLLLGAAATALGGLIILRVGVGDTFVPEDLEFIGLSSEELHALNPHLVPLLAHDRAGFGGGVLTMGITTMLCLWCARPSPTLNRAVALAGAVSLASALIVHFAVGYTDPWHLAPPLVATTLLLTGLALVRQTSDQRQTRQAASGDAPTQTR